MILKKISLVIPVFNEEESISNLINSIEGQSFQPAEVVFVDGGSTDKTIEIIEQAIKDHSRFKLIKTPRASPGKGRNIGVENALSQWIAFTDAGIRLENDWLMRLVEKAEDNPDADVVYGNYTPITNTFFEKCETLALVPAQNKDVIRSRIVPSCLLKKEVWEKVGGFPDLRAAEDLIFVEKVADSGFNIVHEPKAMVHWQLSPNIWIAFRKFILYSKHNVWAGRQWDWHYGIVKQYLLVLPFVAFSVFFSWWWLSVVVLWLCARTTKRILLHRYEYGITPLFNPAVFVCVAFLVLTIDLATMIGWIQAVFNRKEN